jgi:phosphate:Na+ symporter
VKQPLGVYDLWTGLLGGLALFLFGMDLLTRALKLVAGDRMKDILARLTRNRFVGALTGAVVTAVVNSSSVTTVILVGFVSAGLLSMAQCVGVIMGANIGSTMTAQILAFKVSKIALPLVTVGFLGSFLPKTPKSRHYGGAVLGLGLVFYGMSVMSDAMRPLRDYQPFLDLMVTLDTHALAIAAGAVFTAIIQSSAATTGVVIVMAGQGLMSLEAAISVAFGANIGTCATAGLAVIGKPREAVRAAVVHVLFNVIGVLLWYFFIDDLAGLVRMISPAGGAGTIAEQRAAAAPRQIANAHTIFNIVNTLVFIGFTGQIARLVEYLVPDRPLAEPEIIQPKYLDPTLLSTPAMALNRTRLEIGRLGRRALAMVEAVIPAALTGEREQLEEIAAMDDDLDVLHGAIIDYLRQLGVDNLTGKQAREFVTLMKIANAFEAIGDVVETDLVNLGYGRLDESVTVSAPTEATITRFHGMVRDAVAAAIEVAEDDDADAAGVAIAMQDSINLAADEVAIHCAKRLLDDEPNRLAVYTREMEIVERIKRIYYFAKRIAETLHVVHGGHPSMLPSPRSTARPSWRALATEPPAARPSEP